MVRERNNVIEATSFGMTVLRLDADIGLEHKPSCTHLKEEIMTSGKENVFYFILFKDFIYLFDR